MHVLCIFRGSEILSKALLAMIAAIKVTTSAYESNETDDDMHESLKSLRALQTLSGAVETSNSVFSDIYGDVFDHSVASVTAVSTQRSESLQMPALEHLEKWRRDVLEKIDLFFPSAFM